jgi:hypothetical protein
VLTFEQRTGTMSGWKDTSDEFMVEDAARE